MLTERQYKLLTYLREYQNQYGYSPSFEDMRMALGLKSKSGIHTLLSALQERQFIRKLDNRARAIEVLRPDLNTPMAIAKYIEQQNNERKETTPLALMGTIAAGTPIEAIADESNFIDVPPHMVARGHYFALEVSGDSMVDAGIRHGDTVIIKKVDHANTGEIVVALINHEEATLKYFYPENNRITLRAANPRHPDQLYQPEQVEIQGKLHALLRQY
ncbi:MAG: transcriptional repressor LexA [Alphaproteobacteria bacterium]|nr:transcriptional repressor LexA [Alphaproteobacteria bacterium]